MQQLLLMIAIGFVASCALANEDKPAKNDAKLMEGKWVPTEGEIGGKKAPDELIKSTKLELTDGKYTVMVGDKPDKGTWTIDANKSPKTMTINGTEGPNKDKTFLCIYELNGDTLKVCYDLSGKAHPTEFKTKPDTSLFLVTYKREKK